MDSTPIGSTTRILGVMGGMRPSAAYTREHSLRAGSKLDQRCHSAYTRLSMNEEASPIASINLIPNIEMYMYYFVTCVRQ